MKTRVYLAGPINGCTDAEASDWRAWVASRLPADQFDVLDPMRRDYRGREAEFVYEIVLGDLVDIRAADIVLVNATRPTWGTAMELVYATRWGKHIIAVVDERAPVSPWLVCHSSERVFSLGDAVVAITRA